MKVNFNFVHCGNRDDVQSYLRKHSWKRVNTGFLLKNGEFRFHLNSKLFEKQGKNARLSKQSFRDHWQYALYDPNSSNIPAIFTDIGVNFPILFGKYEIFIAKAESDLFKRVPVY